MLACQTHIMWMAAILDCVGQLYSRVSHRWEDNRREAQRLMVCAQQRHGLINHETVMSRSHTSPISYKNIKVRECIVHSRHTVFVWASAGNSIQPMRIKQKCNVMNFLTLQFPANPVMCSWRRALNVLSAGATGSRCWSWCSGFSTGSFLKR